jgi:class 3 adenylate cyclase/tetratricopeptide (TPR) repeat protein
MGTSITATFVFTDLVDSTAIASRLGPEAADGLRQAHFRLLRGAVAASGGTEVKNLGDGLMVMYSSPSRALAGAVGMQQAVEGHNRSGKEPLRIRVGVSAGEATEEDGDYFGDPVVEAARLCGAAEGGQIVAADLVRLMVGRHATQTFVDLGALDLKGVPEPVPAVEVQWEPESVAGSIPLPGRLVGVASDALFGFFGRAPELEVLAEAGKRAQSSGRAQAVFIAGEAGMGKTSLVAHAARDAHADGAVVLFGHSDEDLGVAYQPWIEILSTLVQHSDPETLASLRSAQRSALCRLVPDIGADDERVGDLDTERLLLLEGATELLAAESRRAPVMIVLDDLHWADTASLQLLRHVIASSTPMHLTIACTYRDTDLGRGDPLTQLLADLHREANVTRVALRGLDDTDVMDLIAAAAGHDLDDEGVGLAHALRLETGGNPFFTGEMLRHLGESGAIALGDDGRWRVQGDLADLGLPSSVRDVVGRRVERLGDETVRVLRLAAVIGREFDVTILAHLVDLGEEALLDQMDAAVAAAILVESGVACRYRFAHALTQHSLYDELSPTRRQRAHQRIAETLEADGAGDDPATLAELAHHWVAAVRPADVEKALHYVTTAGDAARDALAPEDATRWYQQALSLLDQHDSSDEARRAQILAELGSAQRQAGYPEHRETLRRAAMIAERLDDTATLVHAALGFRVGGGLAGDEDTKLVLSAALSRVGDTASLTRARLLAILAGAHDGVLEWRTRRELALEAMESARQADDDMTFVEVVQATEIPLATPDRLGQHIADLERAVELADHSADPVLAATTRHQLVAARYMQCDLVGADTARVEMEEITQRVGLPYLRWGLELLSTGRLLLAGDAQAAEVSNERALHLGTEAGLADALGTYGGLVFAIRRHQGRLDEIGEFFIDVARENPSIAALRSIVPFLLAELGRMDEARQRLTAEAASGFDLPFDITWLTGMCNLLDGAAAVGDPAAARRLVERVGPYATQIEAPAAALVQGSAARPLARAATLLGEYDQAEEWFATAHDVHRRLQAPYWTALGELDHADLCLARRADGDVDRARALIDTAAATAAEYGCAALTTRAEQLRATLWA